MEIVATELAVKKFASIQSLIAGPREKMSTRSLFSDKELRVLGVIDLFTKKTHHKDFNRVEHEEQHISLILVSKLK